MILMGYTGMFVFRKVDWRVRYGSQLCVIERVDNHLSKLSSGNSEGNAHFVVLPFRSIQRRMLGEVVVELSRTWWNGPSSIDELVQLAFLNQFRLGSLRTRIASLSKDDFPYGSKCSSYGVLDMLL